jgi:hypothetical protein
MRYVGVTLQCVPTEMVHLKIIIMIFKQKIYQYYYNSFKTELMCLEI